MQAEQIGSKAMIRLCACDPEIDQEFRHGVKREVAGQPVGQE